MLFKLQHLDQIDCELKTHSLVVLSDADQCQCSGEVGVADEHYILCSVSGDQSAPLCEQPDVGAGLTEVEAGQATFYQHLCYMDSHCVPRGFPVKEIYNNQLYWAEVYTHLVVPAL